MSKFLLVLSLLIQLSFAHVVLANEYHVPEAGFKVKLPKQEVNIVGKDFYGGLQPNGDFIYVYSLDEKQAATLLEQKFTAATFATDYESIALLERSGINPNKADLKFLDPQLYWPADKPFIQPLPKDIPVTISTGKLHGKKSLNMQFREDHNNSNSKAFYLCSIDLLAANNRLYVITTKTLTAENAAAKSAEGETADSTRDIYLQSVRLTKPKASTQPLLYTDTLGKFKIKLPDDWYYVQSYFSDDPKACLTFALPLETLKKIKEKTQNIEAADLEKEKIADNVSEESIASWMELITEGIWSVSCETKDFETAAYLENPEATKAEMQLLFSELKNYIEDSRYYRNGKFDFTVDITPKIGYINFDLAFNLKGRKDFDNRGKIFFTRKKGGIIVYTSTIKNTEQQSAADFSTTIKNLDLK